MDDKAECKLTCQKPGLIGWLCDKGAVFSVVGWDIEVERFPAVSELMRKARKAGKKVDTLAALHELLLPEFPEISKFEIDDFKVSNIKGLLDKSGWEKITIRRLGPGFTWSAYYGKETKPTVSVWRECFDGGYERAFLLVQETIFEARRFGRA